MDKKVNVIAIGSKARQGKDTSAQFIKNFQENVYIYHFADPLKQEVMNLKREHPLIVQGILPPDYVYSILEVNDTISKNFSKKIVTSNEVPFLHKIFMDRKIDLYWGMDGDGNDEHKDSLMLQFWGTDWRREHFSQNYWVNEVDRYIENLIQTTNEDEIFILIPDTRFENEVTYLKEKRNAFYLRIDRYNADGTRYIDSNRDPNHPSEIGLDNYSPDYIIKNDAGLDELNEKVMSFFKNYKSEKF